MGKRRGWWLWPGIVVLVGLVAAVTVVLGAFVLRGDREGGDGVADASSAPSGPVAQASDAGAAPSVAPSSALPTATPAAAGPLEIEWTEETWAGAVTAAYTDPASGGLIAVGRVDRDLVAWTSDDGEDWEQHDVPEHGPADLGLESARPEQQQGLLGMDTLVRFTDTVFSIGDFTGFADYVRPVGWRSPDGSSWELITSDSEFYTDAYRIIDAEAGETELLVVNGGLSQAAGGTWRWTPDSSWSQTTPGGVDYHESALSLGDAARGGDRYVLVGSRPSENRATSFVSADGQAWEEAPAAPALTGAAMSAVTALREGGYVAIGMQAGQAAAWTSPDGLAWTPVALPNGLDVDPNAVLAVPGGYLAVGLDLNAVTSTRTWTSRDGATWTEGATLNGSMAPRASRAHAVTATDDVVLLFADQGGPLGAPPQSILWRGTPAEDAP